MRWQYISSDTVFQCTAAILQHGCTLAPTFLGVPLYLFPSPPLRSICLSEHHRLKNLLRLAEIHTSCLTARCHVYPGRSALCNLQPLLNAWPCLCAETRLQTEERQERCRRVNTAEKRSSVEGSIKWRCTRAASFHPQSTWGMRKDLWGSSYLRGWAMSVAFYLQWPVRFNQSTAVPKMSQASQMFGQG